MEPTVMLELLLSLAKYLLLGMTLLLSLTVIVLLFISPPPEKGEDSFPELWWFRKK